jgi:hypothetical protein
MRGLDCYRSLNFIRSVAHRLFTLMQIETSPVLWLIVSDMLQNGTAFEDG